MRSGIMVLMENVASTVADAAYPKTSTHDMLTSFMPSATAFFGVFGGLLFAGPRWGGTQPSHQICKISCVPLHRGPAKRRPPKTPKNAVALGIKEGNMSWVDGLGDAAAATE